MENKRSLLKLKNIPITDKIIIRIPTVGEILEDEQSYYNITYLLSSTPFQQMVQLDNVGIDFTTISEHDLFMQNFISYTKSIKNLKDKLNNFQEETDGYLKIKETLNELYYAIDFVFVGLQEIDEFDIYFDNNVNENIIYNPKTGVIIDKITCMEIMNVIRNINQYEYVKSKPGNESAKKYLLDKERKKLKRSLRKNYDPYLEKMVISLVNTSEFPYTYESCMNLSIYNFNKSFKQIQHKINFDNTMIGVYAGTVSTKEMKDKSVLSWIQSK